MSSASALWSTCSDHIRSQVGDAVWQSTFKPAQPLRVDCNVLALTVPNAIIKTRLEGEYRPLLQSALSSATQDDMTYTVDVLEDMMESWNEPADSDPVPHEPNTSQATTLEATPKPETGASSRLHPDYTFEKFVSGSSNRFAMAAALSVAETPGESYNPLFIYGSVGLGKTHLLQAINHYVTTHHVNGHGEPLQRVRYVTTETFLNEFVDAIRSNNRKAFNQRYREVDILLVDDVQFMEGKEGLQEEFFHTFNSLHEANKQLVIASDRPPDAISTLKDRLISRFKMGLMTDIQPPNLETRLAILRKKAERSKLQIDAEVLSFIASHLTNNIREMEGALTRVVAFASFDGQQVTLDLAQHLLRDSLTQRDPKPITPDDILSSTAELFGFDLGEITGERRQRPLVTARQISMYAFRELTDLSYPAIGTHFGNRDHTTVLHAVNKINKQMAEQPEIFNQVNELIQKVKNS